MQVDDTVPWAFLMVWNLTFKIAAEVQALLVQRVNVKLQTLFEFNQ